MVSSFTMNGGSLDGDICWSNFLLGLFLAPGTFELHQIKVNKCPLLNCAVAVTDDLPFQVLVFGFRFFLQTVYGFEKHCKALFPLENLNFDNIKHLSSGQN